jgi:hypothetical protein
MSGFMMTRKRDKLRQYFRFDLSPSPTNALPLDPAKPLPTSSLAVGDDGVPGPTGGPVRQT